MLPPPPGTGLGLNLSRHIIELHGGELSIESEVGKGTKVGFTLPVSEHNASQIPSPTTTTPLSEEDLQETPGQIESDLPIPEKAKVLVVDDEPVNLEIIEDFLEELPLEITCYSSGDEFLNHLDEDQPNLLIDKLQQLPLVPMDRTVLVSPGLGSGDDLQTQVLLLVR